MRQWAWAGFIMLVAAPLAAQPAIPVHQEPRHRLVFEGQGLRVLDVQLVPGDTSLYHVHATPILYTTIAATRVAEQLVGQPWPPIPGPTAPLRWIVGGTASDTIYPVQPKTHRVTNVTDKPFRLIAVVTMDGEARPFRGAIADELPGTPELRSSWFRQTRLVLAPDESSAWRVPTTALVIISPLEGSLEVVREGGVSTVLATPGAFTVVSAGQRYQVRNTRAAAATAILVQPH